MNRFAILASFALLAACGARGSSTITIPNEDAETDVPAAVDTPVTPDVPKLPDVQVTPDVPAFPDVPMTPDVPVTPDVPMPRDVTTTDTPTMTDAPPGDIGFRTCSRDADCLAGTFCAADGHCTPRVCTPGSSTCVSGTRIRFCDARGAENTEIECPGAAMCADGRCGVGIGCTAGVASCASGTERRVCNPDGMSYTTTTCPAVAGSMGVCTGTGVCSVTCATGFGDCDAVTTNGCEASLNGDSRNCGRCGTACGASQYCSAGACIAIPPPSGATFQVVSLNTTGCRVVDHDAVTSDDHGGIAVGSNSMFYTGDGATARFDLESLTPTTTGRITDGLVSNLRDGTVYTLANGTTPITASGGTVTSLLELDGTTGAPTTRSIMLSSPIVTASGTTGIFAGLDRVILLASGHAYNIELPAGRVIDLGTMTVPTHQSCETWAFWGVAEFFGGALYIDYVATGTTIARTRLPDGMTATLGTFTNLSDMCSFSVSAMRGRWYFHHEGASQFGGTSETAGYCNATLNTSGTISCSTGQTLCDGVCVDTATNNTHCGRCANACTGMTACQSGSCMTVTSFPRYTREAASAGTVFTDVCATGTRVLVSLDDGSATAPALAFPFRFWGTLLPATRTINISSNGFISLDGVSTYSPLSGTIPTTATPNGTIAAFWYDLRTSTTGVCYTTLGTAPSRRFVVEWSNIVILGTTATFNMEVVLNESDSSIDLLYGTGAPTSGSTATIGVENLTGTDSVGGCTTGTVCPYTASTGIHFRPSL